MDKVVSAVCVQAPAMLEADVRDRMVGAGTAAILPAIIVALMATLTTIWLLGTPLDSRA